MDSKQIYKKPTCFKEMLVLQQALDNKIGGTIRTKQQIILSMIAEIIEFNEELTCSHKTWKTKTDHSLDKQKEELIDILFFFLQFINNKKKEDELFSTNSLSWLFNNFDKDKILYSLNDNNTVICLIGDITHDYFYSIATNIVKLLNRFDITQNEFYELYYNKWQINMERVNKKVEEGGWI